MIAMNIIFYMFIFLFALIGAMRGWAKELLVIFSVVLALAFISVIETLIPFLAPFVTSNPVVQFYLRITIVIVIVFFGYQSPRFTRLAKATERKDRIQDILLGLILGAISGYMVYGTIWSFAQAASYPLIFDYVILPGGPQVPGGEASLRLIKWLPPVWLGKPPNIYIAVVLAFIFVIAVFV
jgi:hypothetical protein